jgi:hypothetical protein
MMVGYTPKIGVIPAYLPQIFRAFGIEVAISGYVDRSQPIELMWVGDDGTEIVLGQLRPGIVFTTTSIVSLRSLIAPFSESGHILFAHKWKYWHGTDAPLKLLQTMPEAQTVLHDSIFHSHPVAYAKAIQTYAQTHPLPKFRSPQEEFNIDAAEWALTRVLEPLMAWTESFEHIGTEMSIRQPQYLIQQLWKRYLNNADKFELVKDCYQLAQSVLYDLTQYIDTQQLDPADGTAFTIFNPDYFPVEFCSNTIAPLEFRVLLRACEESDTSLTAFSELEAGNLVMPGKVITAITSTHSGPFPLAASLITTSESQFRITAAKLPEDPDRSGLIVRGNNLSDQELWVTLTPWRAYNVIDVVAMDEEPTGGRLAQESNGAIRFRAAPHRILTFWFHN